jgi:formate hydrogenlyase subunit 4
MSESSESLLSLLIDLAQGALLIVAAPGWLGLLCWFKARMQRRQGPPIYQPYLQLADRFRSQAVRSDATSWVFQAVPYVVFASYGTLAFLVPVLDSHALITADFVVVIYVFGLARFFLSLGGLDAGSPFGMLGSARAMFSHCLTEVGLVLVVAAMVMQWQSSDASMAMQWQSSDLVTLFQKQAALGLTGYLTHPIFVMLAAALFLLTLFECERLPIDNPDSELELTLLGKNALSEYAGRDLAFIQWGEMIKFAFMLSLLGGLFVPLNAPAPDPLGAAVWRAALGLLAWLGKSVLLVAALGLWESGQPKRRLRTIIRPALFAVGLCLLAIIYVMALEKQ